MNLLSFYIYTIILLGVLIKPLNSKYFNILKDLGYENESFNSNAYFLRINSPKPAKLISLTKFFYKDVISEFSFHSIFRFGYKFSKSFVLLFYKSENNLNKLWIYVENGEILVDIKADGNLTMVAFSNPTVFDNKWHKIGLLYNKGKLKLYLDCNLIETNAQLPEAINYLNYYYVSVSAMYLGNYLKMRDEFENFDVKQMVLESGNEDYTYEEDCKDIPNMDFFQKDDFVQQNIFNESSYVCHSN